MKNLLVFILILTSASLFGQAKRLHNLPEVDTVNTIATKKDVSVINPLGGDNGLESTVDSLSGFLSFPNWSNLIGANARNGAILEDRNTGQRYRVRTDSTSFSIPNGDKYLELIRPGFQVLDSTDQVVEVNNYRAGDRITMSSGAVFTVARDTNGVQINDSLSLYRENPALVFSDIDEMRRRRNLIENNSIVTISSTGARYLVSMDPQKYYTYANDESGGIQPRDYTEDSTTLINLGAYDHPVENRVSNSKYIHPTAWGSMTGDFTSQLDIADPYGGRDAAILTATAINETTISLFSTIEGETYTLSVWFALEEDDDSDVNLQVQVRGFSYEDIPLPADGSWYNYRVTFVAQATTDRWQFRLQTGDVGDKIRISHPTVQQGRYRGYVGTGKRQQPAEDQVVYAKLLEDNMTVDVDWFSNVSGPDDSYPLDAAMDYCSQTTSCSGVVHNRDLEITEAGKTIDVSGDYGAVLSSGRNSTIGDQRYRIRVNYNDSTKTFLYFDGSANQTGIGTENIWIEVTGRIGTVVRGHEITKNRFINTRINGNEYADRLWHVTGSSVLNKWEGGEYTNAGLAFEMLTGNGNTIEGVRFLDCDTSFYGRVNMYDVQLEATGLPSVVMTGISSISLMKGERAGGFYKDHGISVDSIGEKPFFYLTSDAVVDVYGMKHSASLDDDSNPYPYLVQLEDGAKFSLSGGRLLNFTNQGPVRADNPSAVALMNVMLPGYRNVHDSVGVKERLSVFNLNSPTEENKPYTKIYNGEMKYSEMDSAVINYSLLSNSAVLDTLGFHEGYIKSSANNYVAHSDDFRFGSGYWNPVGLTLTHNFGTGHEAGTNSSLLVSDGSTNPPYLRYAVGSNPTGRYIISGYLKCYGTTTLTGITTRQVNSPTEPQTTEAIDTNNASLQLFSVVMDIDGSVDNRFDIFFNDLESGDSLEIANIIMTKVSEGVSAGQSVLRPGWVPTSGTIVTDLPEATITLLDTLNLQGTIKVSDQFELSSFADGDMTAAEQGIAYENSIAGIGSDGKLIEIPANWGTRTGTTDVSGDITVTHGLLSGGSGIAPDNIKLTNLDLSCNCSLIPHTIGTSGFSVRVVDSSTGVAAASSSVDFMWEVKAKAE